MSTGVADSTRNATVTLPARPVATGAAGAFTPAMPAAKLLLIDDDARLTAMVGDYLRRNGYDVDAAGSLAAGRERLRGA